MTKIAICYATGSGILRWVAGSSTGDVDKTKFLPANGETILICDHTLITDTNGFFQESLVSQQVATAIGKTPDNSQCAVVVNGTVTGVVRADPVLDAVPGASLVKVYSSAIGVGCTYNSVSKLFTTPQVNAPGDPARGVLPTVVPPTVISNPNIAVTSKVT